MEHKCVRSGLCCKNPSVEVCMTEDDARFYSFFGAGVKKVGKDYKVKFKLKGTCKFYKDGCKIYDNRPQICRDYPVGDVCYGTHRIEGE